jgi:hypothetical protein
MSTTLNPTCPLCGLRFTFGPLLELHIREDHRHRDRSAEPDPGDDRDARRARPRHRAGGER